MSRTNLKLFRVKQKLSQEEMADKIGCSRAGYSAIESGKRTGKQSFWQSFQNVFGIEDSDLWGYMKTDED